MNLNTCVVYRHIRLDKNEPFYIGISSRKRRPYDKHGRSSFWWNIINKTDYRIEILFDNLSWDEACEKEKEFIKLYGRRDLGLGSLINQTDGGEGVVGKPAWNKGIKTFKPSWNAGKKTSLKTRNKISESNKGKPGLFGEKNPSYGKPSWNNKKIIAIDITNNKMIGEFKSVKEAGELLPISYASVKKILSGHFDSIKNIKVIYKVN
jgi:hypothetical protein